jgi:hypothetical protein
MCCPLCRIYDYIAGGGYSKTFSKGKFFVKKSAWFTQLKLLKMKYLLFLITVAFGLITACNKDAIYPGPGTGAPGNRAPNVNAGEDFFVWDPVNEAILSGFYSDPENNVSAISWAKIFGPNSFTFANKESLSTKISGLEKGLYQFELTVTDDKNFFDKDTVSVFVGALSANANEMIVEDLKWISPWYNSIEIKNFVGNGTPGSALKIFIQRDNDPVWTEVLPWDSPSCRPMQNTTTAS